MMIFEDIKKEYYGNLLDDCNLVIDNSFCLCEMKHVADGMDDFVCEFAKIILNKFKSGGSDVTDYVYTGYNFVDDYKQQISSGELKPEAIVKYNNEKLKYPIYYRLVNDKNSSEYANVTWREFGSESEDAVFINVNMFKFDSSVSPITSYYYLIATLSHELQHVFDMYILPDKNSLDKEVNSLRFDINENVFGLEPVYLRNIIALSSLFEQSEVNARLAELNSFVNSMLNNKELRDEIFYDAFNNKFKKSDRTTAHIEFDYLRETDLYSFISRCRPINAITCVHMYNTIINTILKCKATHIEVYNAYMLIIGHYMLKHKLLKTTTDRNLKFQLKKLSDAEWIKSCVDFKNMCCSVSMYEYSEMIKLIEDSIRQKHLYYIKLVNDRLKHNINAFFTYKCVSEGMNVFENECMFDDLIILYR